MDIEKLIHTLNDIRKRVSADNAGAGAGGKAGRHRTRQWRVREYREVSEI